MKYLDVSREEIAVFSSLKKLRDSLDAFNSELASIDGAGARLAWQNQETAAACPTAAEALAKSLTSLAQELRSFGGITGNVLPVLPEMLMAAGFTKAQLGDRQGFCALASKPERSTRSPLRLYPSSKVVTPNTPFFHGFRGSSFQRDCHCAANPLSAPATALASYLPFVRRRSQWQSKKIPVGPSYQVPLPRAVKAATNSRGRSHRWL
jgi:hypothetical protein